MGHLNQRPPKKLVVHQLMYVVGIFKTHLIRIRIRKSINLGYSIKGYTNYTTTNR